MTCKSCILAQPSKLLKPPFLTQHASWSSRTAELAVIILLPFCCAHYNTRHKLQVYSSYSCRAHGINVTKSFYPMTIRVWVALATACCALQVLEFLDCCNWLGHATYSCLSAKSRQPIAASRWRHVQQLALHAFFPEWPAGDCHHCLLSCLCCFTMNLRVGFLRNVVSNGHPISNNSMIIVQGTSIPAHHDAVAFRLTVV